MAVSAAIQAQVTLSSDSREIEQVSNNLAKLTGQLQRFPLFGALLVEDVVFTVGQTQNIPHSLGRAFKNFVPVATTTVSAGYLAFRPAALTDGLTSATHFGVQMQNACTVSFLVW